MSALKITAAALIKKGACADQVETFRKLFPRGTAVTLVAARKATKARLDLYWFTCLFLPSSLRGDYEAKHAPLWADYEAKHTPLDADYDAKHAKLIVAMFRLAAQGGAR